jgi:ribosomal protein S4
VEWDETPRAERRGKEQKAEQRAEHREQRTENREQRTVDTP